MSRFYIAVIVAFALCAASPTAYAFLVGNVAIGALLIAIGLGVVFPQLSFFGPFICSGNSAQRQVALTFDDGPDARSTPALLDLLRAEKIEATFFCIGKNVAANGELTARIVREGHLLENHSYAHSKLTNIFSVGRLLADLARTQAVIEQATGIAPRWFRPPIGLSNPRVFHVARLLHLTVVGWSAGGLDTQLTEPERIVARIDRRLEPGAIILLHDGNIPGERLAVTVTKLLDKLRARGYEVVRLDKMLT